MNVTTLTISGAPYHLGLAHGRAFAKQIAAYAAERVALAGTKAWTGREMGRTELLALASRCLRFHEEHMPRLVEELAGVAAGSGTTSEELLIAGGFTDFVDAVAGAAGEPSVGGVALQRAQLENETDDCTAFLVPPGRMRGPAGSTAGDRTGSGGALAQTWDMHEGSAEHLVLLEGRPADTPDFTVYTTVGCLGMIGMNETGLSVGINNLLAADGRVGVTWPFVVRAMLEQQTLAGALRVLLETPLAGGHSYLVMDAAGAGAIVEAMPTRQHLTRLEQAPLVHANHCLHPETKAVEREREASSQANSEQRQADAERLLDRSGLSVFDLQAITADTASICRVGVAPSYVGTCGAVVMLPATREMLVVGGRPSQAEYRRHEVAAAPA